MLLLLSPGIPLGTVAEEFHFTSVVNSTCYQNASTFLNVVLCTSDFDFCDHRLQAMFPTLPCRLYLCKECFTVERCTITAVSAKPSCRSFAVMGGGLFCLSGQHMSNSSFIFQILTSTVHHKCHFLMTVRASGNRELEAIYSFFIAFSCFVGIN